MGSSAGRRIASKLGAGAVLPVATAVLLILAPSALGAGIYHVNAVSDLSTGAAAPCDGWAGTMNAPEGYAFANVCTSGGQIAGGFMAPSSHAYGDFAHLVFTAPANTKISAFSLRRNSSLGGSQPYGTPVEFFDYDTQSVEGCIAAYGCAGNSEGLVSASSINASTITAGIDCGGGSGGICPSGASSTVVIDGGDITLTSANSPSTTNVSGPLSSSSTLSGTRSISYNATDPAGGVYSGTVLIDGNPTASAIANTNGGRCQPLRVNGDGSRVFNYVVPCPLSTSGSVSIDTAQLTDGVHSVQLVVDDAAGNQTTAYNGTITTHNAPTNSNPPAISAPSSTPQDGQTVSVTDNGTWSPAASSYAYQWLRCDASAANCQAISGATSSSYTLGTADDYKTVEVRVTAHDAAGTSPAATSNALGPIADRQGYTSAQGATAPGGASGATGSLSNGVVGATPPPAPAAPPAAAAPGAAAAACTPVVTTSVQPQADGTYVLSGTVTCNGQPVPGARITVTDSSGLSRTLTANGDGTFTTVLKTLHDGLTVVYGGNRFPVASVGTTKQPKITLKVTPKRTRNRRRITFTGRVTNVATTASKTPTLLVEYKLGAKWRPFDTCPVKKDGTFVYRYRFMRTTRPTVYHLRVALSSLVASPARTVRVN